MSKTRFFGLYTPALTPYTKDGSVNYSAIEKFCEFFYGEDSVEGAFLTGTSGESMSLTKEERKKILETWIETNKRLGSRLRFIAHIGAQSIQDSIELAKHAQECGVAAIAIISPAFFRPKTIDLLVEYVRVVASHADRTPIFYYHFPRMTNVSFSVNEFLKKASPLIPTLQGAKFSDTDLRDFNKSLKLENGRFDILMGFGHHMVPVISIGCAGAVGVGANFAPELYPPFFNFGLKKTEESLNEANEAQQRMIALLDIIDRHDNAIAPFKVLAGAKLGIDFGSVRLPLKSLSNEEAQKLIEDVEQIGFPVRSIN
jgi:N-acetylneuraminate lyase